MVIASERLYARPWSVETDVGAVIRMYSHPDVVRFIGDKRIATQEAAQDFIRFRIDRTVEHGGRYGSWALVERASDELIGNILLKPLPAENRVPTKHIEVGWHLARQVWGRGYATEAGGAMLERAFGELGLKRVVAVTEPGNTRSMAVMLRVGMTHLGQCSDFYDGALMELFERCAP
jgi:RimJ/RimL family protein N-acetyltransferase